ncbi:MAG: hypothetical protein JW738_10335, partial [Actinobacteria bacterium]|nr:hypothetical protein [Actinomycetota bacterium]
MNENPLTGKVQRCFSVTGLVALITALLIVLLPASTCFSAGLWGPQGVDVCSAYAFQDESCIVSDGAGGAIISWTDERAPDYYYNIYAQRVDPSGNVLWAQLGVPVYVGAYNAYDPQSVSDGAGGAIITWRDYRNGTSHIFVQRINSAGQVLWTANGVAVGTAGSSNNQRITTDGAGGAIITWYDDRNGNSDIFAQRINASGTAVWPANGVQICTAAGSQYDPRIVPGGSGSAVITWEDDRNVDSQYDIYAQKVSTAGAAQWTADGVPVSTAAGDKYNPMITASGSGDSIITWADERSGEYPNVYAQKLNAQGAVQWAGNGVVVCNADGGQEDPNIVSDDAGGAIIAWHDIRSDSQLIYAQKINSNGTAGWAANGVPVNSTYAGWEPI